MRTQPSIMSSFSSMNHELKARNDGPKKVSKDLNETSNTTIGATHTELTLGSDLDSGLDSQSDYRTVRCVRWIID